MQEASPKRLQPNEAFILHVDVEAGVDAILPSMVILAPSADPLDFLRQCLAEMDGLGFVQLYRGEVKKPLPLAPEPAIVAVECSKWGYFRARYVPAEGDYCKVIEPYHLNSKPYLDLFGEINCVRQDRSSN